jgi:transaldolase
MTNTTSPLDKLTAMGVSIWLDDLSRERLVSGDLERLIDERNVVGVTTNPTIIANALTDGEQYSEQVAGLKAVGASGDDAV